jgi:hypothetical protein
VARRGPAETAETTVLATRARRTDANGALEEHEATAAQHVEGA